jgi:hypothetical protein
MRRLRRRARSVGKNVRKAEASLRSLRKIRRSIRDGANIGVNMLRPYSDDRLILLEEVARSKRFNLTVPDRGEISVVTVDPSKKLNTRGRIKGFLAINRRRRETLRDVINSRYRDELADPIERRRARANAFIGG